MKMNNFKISKLVAMSLLVLVFASQANAIDSEPILATQGKALNNGVGMKGSFVAIDSEPILRIFSVGLYGESNPDNVKESVAIDSEPILKEELSGMSMIYKKDGKFIKVTYKAEKAEEVKKKNGQRMEKEGLVQRLSK